MTQNGYFQAGAPVVRVYRHRLALAVTCLALVALTLLSIVIGSRSIALTTVISAVFQFTPLDDEHLVMWSLRIPRTIVGVLAGFALGIAGAVTQSVTRNILAEPGLLGVNAGAALLVIAGIVILGIDRIDQYVWLGFAGAAFGGVAVLALGGWQQGAFDPTRLLLAGAGLSAALGSMTGVIIINAPLAALDNFRNWAAGSLEGRDFHVAFVLAGAVAVGFLLAMSISSRLNVIALGHDVSRSLGAKTSTTTCWAGAAVSILAGASTAAIGPIVFLGLAAPHLARLFFGSDHRWLLPASGLFGSCILLAADVIGRIVAPPREVPAGIIVLLLGGVLFVLMVRRFALRRSL